MSKITKRRRAISEKVEFRRMYPIEEAINILKEVSTGKFVETVDIAVNLGIDSRKSDQVVRGATTLPYGTGKEVRVCVFAQGEGADLAKSEGAEYVGMDELADQLKKGELTFDVVIAAPEAMRVVGALGKILGPRGLMPNPKSGTVTADVATAVKNASLVKFGFVLTSGIVHGGIGMLSFESEAIKGNLKALIADLTKIKPASSKGVYLKKITLSSTMGPGLIIDKASLDI